MTWYGHLMRMELKRITRKVLEAKCNKKRKRENKEKIDKPNSRGEWEEEKWKHIRGDENDDRKWTWSVDENP